MHLLSSEKLSFSMPCSDYYFSTTFMKFICIFENDKIPSVKVTHSPAVFSCCPWQSECGCLAV